MVKILGKNYFHGSNSSQENYIVNWLIAIVTIRLMILSLFIKLIVPLILGTLEQC